LNHLINFSFPPRQQHTLAASSSIRKRSGSGCATHHVPFNKERFINSNYRFHVRPEFNYSASLSDPDSIVDWSRILHVIVPTAKEVLCPICLSAPTAPRMTRCGHVFCYPCVLHYLDGESRLFHPPFPPLSSFVFFFLPHVKVFYSCGLNSETYPGNKYGNCPICHDYVSSTDLKSTHIATVKAVEKGQTLNLTLVKRGVVSTHCRQYECI
jgi:hypothetical protein